MNRKYIAMVRLYRPNPNDYVLKYVAGDGSLTVFCSEAASFDSEADASIAANKAAIEQVDYSIYRPAIIKIHEINGTGSADRYQAGTWSKAKPETITPSDAVQSPAHYQLGGIEAIDVIDEAVADPTSFYRGNAIKYLLRAGRKGDAHEDLRKARYYIDRELSHE